MEKRVVICDTTLRDGVFSPGFTLEPKEMLEIARQLERLGVDIIVVGDAANADQGAVSQLAEKVSGCALSVVSRLSISEVETADKLLQNATKKRVDIVAPVDAQRMLNEYQLDFAGMKQRVGEVVAFAKQRFGEVEVTFQISSEADSAALNKLAAIAADGGADVVCIEDKGGSCAPTEFYHIVDALMKTLDGSVSVSVCCRNDLGMAAANTLSAIKAGAAQIECSVNGIGSRAGRAPLEEVAAALFTRPDYYGATTGINMRQIYRTSRLVATLSGYSVPAFRPVVGDGVLANANSPVKPEVIGVIRNNLVLGKHTTEAEFEQRADDLGYVLAREQLSQAFAQFQLLAGKKRSVTDRDIEAILEPLGIDERGSFELVNFVINSGTMFPSTATVILKQDGQELVSVSTGSGPVDAAFRAVDNISEVSMQLEDFSLQSVTEGEDAQGSATVRVRCGDKAIWGRGVSTDIVEASIRAYIHALNKAVGQ